MPELVGPFLIIVGAFYAFAGVVATRAGLTSRLLDKAISQIDLEPPKRAETLRALWMVLAGLMILAGGVALLLKVDIAAALFALSAGAQGLYLTVIAPRYLDRDDPVDAAGRRQTINAFVLYLLATAFVLWAYARGHLYGAGTVPWPLAGAAGCAFGAFAAHTLYTFARPLQK